MIHILKSIIKNLKNVNVIPVGVTSQMTIDENGNAIEKSRLTYNCSWIGPSSYSLNSRINEDLLAPLQYGRFIYRVLHNIQMMRFKYPSK